MKLFSGVFFSFFILLSSYLCAFDGLKKQNLNSISYERLVDLPGVGPKTAELIIAERKKKRFSRLTELLNIRGIGTKKVQKLSLYLYVEKINSK